MSATRVRRAAGCMFAAIGVLYVAISATPVVTWWARLLAGRWDNGAPADVLIVLGGSTLDDGTVGESSYWRSVYAVREYRGGHVRRMLISGGPAAAPVSAAMRDFIVASGVPRDAVAIETGSTSTRENALAAARLLLPRGGERILLLTSDYHMFRASHAFAKAGLRVDTEPVPDALKRATRWRGRWPALLDLCDESAKIAYYSLRGWL